MSIGFQVSRSWACKVGFPVRRVVRPDRVRHQSLDGLADQLVACKAEKRLRPVIDVPDHPRPVHPHQGTGHRLQEAHPVRLVPPVREMFGRGLFTCRRHLFSLPAEPEMRTLSLHYAAETRHQSVPSGAVWRASRSDTMMVSCGAVWQVIEALSRGSSSSVEGVPQFRQ